MPRSSHARWVLVASILGSGAAFLETSVVSVALPAIGRGLDLGVAGLEAVTNGYLLTLSALMLLGGTLGDEFPRARVFAVGLGGFALACAGCALASTAAMLVTFRVMQGIFGALLVPNSLAMLETTFTGEARGAAIGQWSAWSAVSTAFGPLLGGWVTDRGSWRWVFAIMIPPALIAAGIAVRHGEAVEPTRDRARGARIDYAGAALVTLALAAAVGSLTLATKRGPTGAVLGLGAVAVVLFGTFIIVEKRSRRPLVPLEVFRSRVFTAANIVTLLVYAALGGVFFMLMLELQDEMGYGALQAGASLLPINFLMLIISPVAGRLAHRIGPRWPLAVGSLLAGVGMALFARVHPGATFVGAVLPAVVVFGFGLSILVAPLTAAVLGALEDRLAGLASGVNNAVARVAGLLATAILPLVAGVGASTLHEGHTFTAGFVRAMWISAGVCAVAAVVALVALPGSSRGQAA